MMAAALVLCLMSFFIVAGSVAYASILVSTCAACVGFTRARLPYVPRVNLPGVRRAHPRSPTPYSPCQLERRALGSSALVYSIISLSTLACRGVSWPALPCVHPLFRLSFLRGFLGYRTLSRLQLRPLDSWRHESTGLNRVLLDVDHRLLVVAGVLELLQQRLDFAQVGEHGVKLLAGGVLDPARLLELPPPAQ